MSLLLLIPSARARERNPKTGAISRITIRGTDIFDFETKSNLRKVPYTWINSLHIQTKEHVLRRQLLFKEGDPVDPFLLRETERNLRGLPFIRAARCVVFPQRDGTSAVVVHVNDSWTTEPQINLSGANRVDKLEIGFKEKNFLGLGKTISYFHTKKDDIDQDEFGYFDPNLFGTRWQLDGDYIEATNGATRMAVLERPFYATDVRWSSKASHEHSKKIIEEFSDNVKVSEFEQTKEITEIGEGVKLGHSRHTVNRAGLRYRREHVAASITSKSIPGQLIPETVTRQVIITDLQTFRNRFIEAHGLEKMTRVEDINLGAKLSLSPGYAPRDLTGTKSSSQFQGQFEKYTELGEDNLLFTLFSHESRKTFEKDENIIYRFTVKNYYKGWRNQTLVAHSRFEFGERLDADSELVLGGENGLRAFKNIAFRGAKSLLLNLEDRMVFAEDVWDLFSIGAAAFIDSGYVWEKNEPIAFSDLRSSVGIGLRLGLTRSSSEVVIRMDISRRLAKAPGDSEDWVLTFGSGQAF